MRVLFVVTRFPVPAWRGDQVRAFHHLRLLAERHPITCCALVATAPPGSARRTLEALGVRVEVCVLGRVLPALLLGRALGGDPRPLQVLLYARQRARAAVARLLAAERFDVVHAQLVRAMPAVAGCGVPLVTDLIDALSANFLRRGRVERGPLAWVAAEEARRLVAYEAEAIRASASCLLVSAGEANALGAGPRLRVVPNGVDGEAFAYRPEARAGATIVFGGNLGYFPNVDAAAWLARDILPRVRAHEPAATLRLVGARPRRAVRALTACPGVTLAADVPAMAPELAAASVAVLPLRAGSGLQNKVLEAMAVGTPVVATSRAVAGLDVRAEEHLLVADDAAGIAAATVTLLRTPERARVLAAAARRLIETRYRWETSAAGVEAAWCAAVEDDPRAARHHATP